ncbi:hypothetical protein EsVE80_15560 [Enterococcus saigonensis]|uniref:Uncharacterized protein n=1 Tax=Enterococcus saigonensis TaxID=1805431 RepID=A0A679ICS0_9ENTE|nr:hypothetical protein [Enterococcus saigonensis]BCA86033.1 hypothetical protein EsVE80_15560 [Enterococcus saigonensis]
MEKIKKEYVKNRPITKGSMIQFISTTEVENARAELKANKIDERRFSDGEIILAIQQKKEVGAQTIVPIVVDWLVENNFIVTGAQAVKYLLDNTKYDSKPCLYKVVGELDFDTNGKFYLIVATSPKSKIESLFKVYTNGVIKELWVEH